MSKMRTRWAALLKRSGGVPGCKQGFSAGCIELDEEGCRGR